MWLGLWFSVCIRELILKKKSDLKKDRDFEIFNLPKFRFEVQIKWSFKLSVSGNMIDLVLMIDLCVSDVILREPDHNQNLKAEILIRKFNNIHGQLTPCHQMIAYNYMFMHMFILNRISNVILVNHKLWHN